MPSLMNAELIFSSVAMRLRPWSLLSSLWALALVAADEGGKENNRVKGVFEKYVETKLTCSNKVFRYFLMLL